MINKSHHFLTIILRPAFSIFCISFILSISGCSVTSYMTGNFIDGKRSYLTDIEFSEIDNKLNQGDDIVIVFEDGTPLECEYISADAGRSINVKYENTEIEALIYKPSIHQTFDYHQIASISRVDKPSTGRIILTPLGLNMDFAAAAILLIVSQSD